ncbi:MAG: DNRLRE domain-containing protein [Gaiellaceae bacterium]
MRRPRLTFRCSVAVLAVVSILGAAGAAYAASLPLVSGHLWSGSQPLTKTTCDQTATTAYDTDVQEASKTSSSGGTAKTVAVSNISGSREYAFIRFDISGCAIPATTGGADDAVLTIRVNSATRTNHTISLYPVYSSWTESLTWNSSLSLTIGSTATTTFTTSTGSKALTVTAALDSAIKAGAFWGWELVDSAGSGNNTTKIASSENNTANRRPSMTLSYER